RAHIRQTPPSEAAKEEANYPTTTPHKLKIKLGRQPPRPERARAAATAATQALLLARPIGAPRCTSLTEALLPRFQPYRSTPVVPELLDLAAA
ncbi:hypothetical protein ABTZ11_43480, partial [Streptomyces sp. NPDC095817]